MKDVMIIGLSARSVVCGRRGTLKMLHVLRKVFSLSSGLLILFVMIVGCNAYGEENMEIKKGEDKTTYTIGSSQNKKDGKTEEERDKERAWDMLKNMNTIIDKRGQGGQNSGQ